jgi:hypothetical protein
MRLARNCPNVPKPTMPILSCLSCATLLCILASKSNGCAASSAYTLTQEPGCVWWRGGGRQAGRNGCRGSVLGEVVAVCYPVVKVTGVCCV